MSLLYLSCEHYLVCYEILTEHASVVWVTSSFS